MTQTKIRHVDYSYVNIPSLALSMLTVFLSLHSTAYADSGIQMLPPTDFNGAPCSADTGGLLQWDGATSIKCVSGALGDNDGNVSVNGTLRPGTNNIQLGNACSSEGAIGYDNTSITHQLVFCNSSNVWTSTAGTSGVPSVFAESVGSQVSSNYFSETPVILTDIPVNTIKASLAAGNLVLPAGKYYCRFMAVGADGGSTGGPVWAQLADLTHGGILATGPNITNTAYGRGPISNASEGVGVFTLSSTTMIQLQQFTTSGGTDAYNMTAQLGRIEVWKM